MHPLVLHLVTSLATARSGVAGIVLFVFSFYYYLHYEMINPEKFP